MIRPKRSINRAGCAAFTLVELLVVVAIVGILAALAAQALHRGKQSAQQMRCGSNLRQLGLAGQMYWDDHDGLPFAWRGAATNNGQIYWFGWLGAGQEGQRSFDPAAGALFPYLQGRGVELCPALPYSSARFKLKATGASYGYGYNIHLSPPFLRAPVNINQLQQPSETVFLADAAQINTFQPPASPENPMVEEFYYVSTYEATTHFRHNNTSQTIACDGHLQRDRPDPALIDPRLPTAHIGRLPSSRLIPR